MKIPKWIKDFFSTGPYLDNGNRLADVLAAIQVLGTYVYATRELDKWKGRLGRVPRSADSWEEVFNQHPEFFTVDNNQNIALVWRRSFSRDYDAKNKKIVTGDELERLKEEEKRPGAQSVLTREPLTQEQIEHLCNLAINLHEREIQHRQEKRWWSTAVVAVIVAIISLFG